MNNRMWVLGTFVLTAVILVVGWFVGIAPVLSQATIANTDRSNVEAQNARHEITLASLKKRFGELGALTSELASSRVSLPSDAATASFLGQLNRLQLEHGVVVTDFTVEEGIPFAPVEAEPLEGAEETDETGADAELELAASAESNIENASLVTEENFIAIPVTLSAAGESDAVMNFVSGLQSGSRLFLVTELTVDQKEEGSTSFVGDITGFIYVLLDPTVDRPASENAPVNASTAAAD